MTQNTGEMQFKLATKKTEMMRLLRRKKTLIFNFMLELPNQMSILVSGPA